MSGDEIRTRLVIEPDQQAADKSEKAIADIEKSLGRAGDAAKRYTSELVAATKEAQRIKALPAQFAELAAQTGNADKALEGLVSELAAVGKSQSQINSAVTAFDKLVKKSNEAATAAARTGKNYIEAAREARRIELLPEVMTKLAVKTGDAARAADRLVEELRSAGKSDREIERAVEQFERLNREVKEGIVNVNDLGKGVRNVGGGADFGGAAGNLGKISSFAGGIGLGGAGEIGNIAKGLLDVADAAPKLTKNIGETAKAAANSVPVIGTLASGLQSAVPGLGAAGASLTAIGAVALPLVAAVGALTLGLSALSKANRDAAQSAKEYVDLLAADAATYADITVSLREGNIDAARSQVTAIQAQQERRAIELQQLEQDLAEAQELRRQEQEAQRQGLSRRGERVLDRLGLQNTAAEETVNNLTTRIEELRNAAATGNQEIASAIRAFDEAGVSIVALANDTSALAAQQELAAAEDQLAATRTRAAQTIASLNEQESALLARAQETERLLAEDRGIASARAQEDLERQQERQAQDLAKKLTDIQQRSNDTILSIRTAAIEAEKQLIQGNVDALAKITADEQKKLTDVNKQFFAREIAATQKFRDEVAKADAAFAKQRARRLDDLNDQLLSAEQANDVTAFIAAQRAAEKDLKRQQEDLDDQSRARQDAFIAERQAARDELTARVADIQTESAALRSERAASFTEEMAALKTNTAARIAEEKRAVVERLAQEKQAAAERQKLDDENRAIQQRRAQEDQQRQDQRRQAALQAQLDEIERKRQAEQTAIDDLIARIMQLQQVIAQIRPPQQLTQTTTQTAQTGNMASLFGRFNSTIDQIRRGSAGGTTRPIPFADGGIITSPFQGMVRMAEREPEAIVPLSRLGGMGNVNVPVNISGVNFNGAGSGEIEAVLQSVVEVIQRNVVTAVETARSRPVMR